LLPPGFFAEGFIPLRRVDENCDLHLSVDAARGRRKVESPLESMIMRATKRRQGFLTSSSLLLLSFAALAFALYPIYVIRPFREQKPLPLQRALWVTLHDRPILIGVFLLLTVCALFVWRRADWISKFLLLAPAMAIALIAAGAAWVNPYEQLMFHGFGEPRYVSIQRTGIDPKDMVIAVTLGGESRAYPIREMGYHHIVNDRLHQLPIVVTY
jgi:Protein of unknown function (DUF3179)